MAAILLSASPLTLAAPGLSVVGFDEKTGLFLGEHVAQQLKLAGAKVVTQKEMAAVLGAVWLVRRRDP